MNRFFFKKYIKILPFTIFQFFLIGLYIIILNFIFLFFNDKQKFLLKLDYIFSKHNNFYIKGLDKFHIAGLKNDTYIKFDNIYIKINRLELKLKNIEIFNRSILINNIDIFLKEDNVDKSLTKRKKNNINYLLFLKFLNFFVNDLLVKKISYNSLNIKDLSIKIIENEFFINSCINDSKQKVSARLNYITYNYDFSMENIDYKNIYIFYPTLKNYADISFSKNNKLKISGGLNGSNFKISLDQLKIETIYSNLIKIEHFNIDKNVYIGNDYLSMDNIVYNNIEIKNINLNTENLLFSMFFEYKKNNDFKLNQLIKKENNIINNILKTVNHYVKINYFDLDYKFYFNLDLSKNQIDYSLKINCHSNELELPFLQSSAKDVDFSVFISNEELMIKIEKMKFNLINYYNQEINALLINYNFIKDLIVVKLEDQNSFEEKNGSIKSIDIEIPLDNISTFKDFFDRSKIDVNLYLFNKQKILKKKNIGNIIYSIFLDKNNIFDVKKDPSNLLNKDKTFLIKNINNENQGIRLFFRDQNFEKIFIDKINYLGYNFIDSFVKNYDDRFVTLIQINDLNLKDFYSKKEDILVIKNIINIVRTNVKDIKVDKPKESVVSFILNKFYGARYENPLYLEFGSFIKKDGNILDLNLILKDKKTKENILSIKKRKEFDYINEQISNLKFKNKESQKIIYDINSRNISEIYKIFLENDIYNIKFESGELIGYLEDKVKTKHINILLKKIKIISNYSDNNYLNLFLNNLNKIELITKIDNNIIYIENFAIDGNFYMIKLSGYIDINKGDVNLTGSSYFNIPFLKKINISKIPIFGNILTLNTSKDRGMSKMDVKINANIKNSVYKFDYKLTKDSFILGYIAVITLLALL